MKAKAENMALGISGDLMDMLRCQSELDARKQQAWILDWFTRCGVQLFVCSGNHDLYPSERFAEWLVGARRPGLAVDGGVVEWCGRRIAVMPYSVGPSAMMQRIFTQPAPDLVLHHEPPARTRLSLAANSGGDFGSDELRDAIDSGWKPKVVVCGHVHRPEGHSQFVRDTLCINLAGDPRSVPPAHAVLDLETGIMERFSPRPAGVHQNPDW